MNLKKFNFFIALFLTILCLLAAKNIQANVIPQTNWSLWYVDSEETSCVYKPGIYAFDGDPNTIWHTQWCTVTPAHPHEIQIDLGSTYDINGFRYLPRQDGNLNGTISNYEYYVSSDGVNWGIPVATGNFSPSDATEKEIIFSTVVGRYVKLRALGEVNGNPWTSAAELNVLGVSQGSVLSITPASATLVVNGQQTFDGAGGVPPYSFNVIADTTNGATINSNGLYTAGPNVGQSTVQVMDDNNDTAEATVTVNAMSSVIPQTNWSLWYVDSEETSCVYKPGIYAFDGDPNTIWHTQWCTVTPAHPHEIQIDLGSTYDINGFRYLPRQDGNLNGTISNYEYYVSSDGVNWGIPVATGNFSPSDATEKEIIFSTVVGRYVKLRALGEVNGNPWTSAAELNVLGVSQGSVLSITPASATLVVNGQQTFDGAGGVPPYSFNVIADTTNGATINSNGLYTAGPNVGQSTVQVMDDNNDTAEATVTVNAMSSVIPQTNWSLWYVDSEELDATYRPGIYAFDGDSNTWWHTQYFNAEPPHPHEIQIDLGSMYDIDGFRYLPRPDGQNGRIGIYQLFLSGSTPTIPPVESEWGTPVATGIFSLGKNENEIRFPRTTARFVRLVAWNEVNDNPWTSVAELNVLGGAFSGNYSPDSLIDVPNNNLTIMVGDAVAFSGTGTDIDGPFPLSYLWNFGDPTLPESNSPDPGTIVFDNPGTFTVSFTVADASGNRDSSPATRIVKVLKNGVNPLIPQTAWTLKYVDSEELDAVDKPGVYAFDGDNNTIWHTQWYNADPLPPHDIQINLGSAYSIDGFHYLPRQDQSENGQINKYQFYVSVNGKDWGAPVAEGKFANDKTEKSILFTPKVGQFIRLEELNEVNGNPWASAAEINVEGQCEVPYIKIINPDNNAVYPEPNLSVTISVCLNKSLHSGWGVKFILDGGSQEQVITLPPDGIIYPDTFKATFNGPVPSDNHTVECYIIDDHGVEVSGAQTYYIVNGIGVGDDYVAYGDSITEGSGDDDSSDDVSADGRNSGPGYPSILNDLLTTAKGYPHYIANEGVGGETSAGGLVRLLIVFDKDPNSQYFLIQYGTNDGAGLFPIPSGKGLSTGDLGYPGSFKDNMQQIIDMITSEGKSAYLAKVPFSLYPSLNEKIIDYNIVINELVAANNIQINPPDFYLFFESNQDQLSDGLHPDGNGYKSMANLWSYAILNPTSP